MRRSTGLSVAGPRRGAEPDQPRASIGSERCRAKQIWRHLPHGGLPQLVCTLSHGRRQQVEGLFEALNEALHPDGRHPGDGDTASCSGAAVMPGSTVTGAIGSPGPAVSPKTNGTRRRALPPVIHHGTVSQLPVGRTVKEPFDVFARRAEDSS